ncbi:MAG TPA: type VI secretion system accessory protein TagJ [Ideonella sp.]|uniref:type VI secretion system accessory protein TagJ n=1 Tax=Ideonella sp. TaxID=1929293 RepID=UPI002C48ECE5|nr:type VI secretion system accessory protein TagJ [Ideonella sp.]HSI49060.1 type VI secretion system accessory protein TagJ [Ideonella sp.]
MDTIKELVAAGRPREALAQAQQQVRAKPQDAKLRVLLFQLLAITGQWQRASTQLAVCGELDAEALPMVNTYREALKCELVREAVFDGKTTPMLLGQPAEWVALLVEALRLQAEGQVQAARAMREQALGQAETVAGSLDGAPFEWICDADSRLGPLLEAVVNGRYAWVPFSALSKVQIEAPSDLRDLAWLPAHLCFPNGGETVALIPTRYPRSTTWDDERVWMARRTEWTPLAAPGAEQYAGVGQRVFATDAGEHSLLDVRCIELGRLKAD